MKKNNLILLLICLIAIPASAYIPNLQMILERVEKNHGYGFFLIDQEVVLNDEKNSYVLHEQWLVENENLLRLRVTGEQSLKGQLDMTFVYNYNKRYTINENSKKVATSISPQFIEPLFHFRKANYLISQLARIGVAPRSTLNKLLKESTEISSSPDIRLARSGGVVNYFIGTPASAGGDKNPGLWIEQDQFLIRKLRYSDNAVVTAEDYSRNTRGMMFPQLRSIRWGANAANIQVRRVKTASSSVGRVRVRQKSLNVKKEPHLVQKMPDIDLIKNFYNRFR